MPIKVLHLLSSTGLFGAENVVIELIKCLQNKSLRNYLGIIENNNKSHAIIIKETQKYGIPTQLFHCRWKFDYKTIYCIKEFVIENQINLIHSHKYKSNLFSLLATKDLNIPLVSTCHNWLGENYKMKFYEYIDKKILLKFNKVVAVSKEIEEKLLRSGILPNKLCRIENGININKYVVSKNSYAVKDELNIDRNHIVVGFVGRLDKNKGLYYLLRAAKRIMKDYTNLVFLIIGEGPVKEELIEEAKELEISEKVLFTGRRDDMHKIYSVIDIFVLPSFKEGFPLVLLEAMASMKPVIATRVGDIPDILSNGAGVLIDPGNEEAISSAITSLIKDRDKAETIAKIGYERVIKNYSSEIMTHKYIQIYKDAFREKAILN